MNTEANIEKMKKIKENFAKIDVNLQMVKQTLSKSIIIDGHTLMEEKLASFQKETSYLIMKTNKIISKLENDR